MKPPPRWARAASPPCEGSCCPCSSPRWLRRWSTASCAPRPPCRRSYSLFQPSMSGQPPISSIGSPTATMVLPSPTRPCLSFLCWWLSGSSTARSVNADSAAATASCAWAWQNWAPQPDMKASSIELRNLSKRYGNVAAVHNISFTVAAGTLLTLLGPSGCGKTTTLRLIAGLEPPSSGTVLIGGVDVTQTPASERDVSMVFQSYALFPHMNVIENVGYGLSVAQIRKAQVHDKAQAARAAVGL